MQQALHYVDFVEIVHEQTRRISIDDDLFADLVVAEVEELGVLEKLRIKKNSCLKLAIKTTRKAYSNLLTSLQVII